MAEAPGQQYLVVLVHQVKQVEWLFAVLGFGSLNRFLDEVVLQDGQQHLCDNHRDEEHDAYSPGEGKQDVFELSLHHNEEREEGHRDTQRSGKD